jgi:hypothetical protein
MKIPALNRPKNTAIVSVIATFLCTLREPNDCHSAQSKNFDASEKSEPDRGFGATATSVIRTRHLRLDAYLVWPARGACEPDYMRQNDPLAAGNISGRGERIELNEPQRHRAFVRRRRETISRAP